MGVGGCSEGSIIRSSMSSSSAGARGSWPSGGVGGR